jgi:hypothetical protein
LARALASPGKILGAVSLAHHRERIEKNGSLSVSPDFNHSPMTQPAAARNTSTAGNQIRRRQVPSYISPLFLGPSRAAPFWLASVRRLAQGSDKMRWGEEAAEGRELREGSGGQGRTTRQQRSGKGGLDGRLTSA